MIRSMETCSTCHLLREDQASCSNSTNKEGNWEKVSNNVTWENCALISFAATHNLPLPGLKIRKFLCCRVNQTCSHYRLSFLDNQRLLSSEPEQSSSRLVLFPCFQIVKSRSLWWHFPPRVDDSGREIGLCSLWLWIRKCDAELFNSEIISSLDPFPVLILDSYDPSQ